MIQLKYIRTKNGQFVVFPESINHNQFEKLEPISAGYIQLYDNKAICYGESVTLGLKPMKDDSERATRQFFNN
jgi:hypothetical protein